MGDELYIRTMELQCTVIFFKARTKTIPIYHNQWIINTTIQVFIPGIQSASQFLPPWHQLETMNNYVLHSSTVHVDFTKTFTHFVPTLNNLIIQAF